MSGAWDISVTRCMSIYTSSLVSTRSACSSLATIMPHLVELTELDLLRIIALTTTACMGLQKQQFLDEQQRTKPSPESNNGGGAASTTSSDMDRSLEVVGYRVCIDALHVHTTACRLLCRICYMRPMSCFISMGAFTRSGLQHSGTSSWKHGWLLAYHMCSATQYNRQSSRANPSIQLFHSGSRSFSMNAAILCLHLLLEIRHAPLVADGWNGMETL